MLPPEVVDLQRQAPGEHDSAEAPGDKIAAEPGEQAGPEQSRHARREDPEGKGERRGPNDLRKVEHGPDLILNKSPRGSRTLVWVLLNDRIVPEENALVSVFDRGFTYGDGVFETLRVYDGHPFRLEAHLVRFGEAVRALRLPMSRTPERVAADIRDVLLRNQLDQAVVRFQLSRGRGGRGPGIQDVGDPTWVVAAWPLPSDLDTRIREGARVSVVSIRRLHPATLPSGAKLANYLNSILAVAEASELGSDEGLMLTPDGLLAECGAANLFYVRGGELLTPALDLGVLPGVTRQVILELAREAGIPVRESADPPSALLEASEVFLTNSILGLWPVRSIDGRPFPSPGPLTSRLEAAYAAGVARHRS